MTKAKNPTLKEIQSAISAIDKTRLDPSLSAQEQKILELSAVALRDAERLAIAKINGEILKDLEATTQELKSLSRSIRTRVTRMNKLPKALDKIEKVIKEIVRILTAITKWI